ncbi:MAG: type II toxin-antitoxin system VapC family toxin [Halobacteriota archaeon]
MKISLDTSIIVEIERRNEKIIEFIENLLERHEIFISVVVPSEVFTGTYLRIDYEKATQKAKRLFLKFEIVPLNMEIAEIIGKINAFLIANGSIIEYQDVAIAATFIYKMGDYLLTKNNKHFVRIPELIDKVLTPDEVDRMR